MTTKFTALVVVTAMLMSPALEAQNVLGQLGLTEASARTFVINEIKSPTTDRRGDIVLTGRRALLKLPRSARGPAVTALFAWARAYVNSPQFKATYAGFRRDVLGPEEKPRQTTIDEEVQKLVEEQQAGFAQLRQAAAGMPPTEATAILKVVAEAEARIQSGELAKMLRAGIEADRAETAERNAASVKRDNEQYPADPEKVIEHRLREFLDATADVNFAARTISLTGGPDGIEFVDKVDRSRPWMWHEAVIVGPEATAAARAAAEAWLREISQ